MKIRRPLTADPEKARQWQQRSQAKAIAKLREKGATLAPRETGWKKPALPAGSPLPTSAALKRSQPGARKPASRAKTPPNDSFWRNACIMARGEMCRSCGDTANVEMDHVIPKSQDQTARADVENGLPLCGAFSRNTPGGCHPAKTAGKLLLEPEWFDKDQLEYLARKGWVDWDADGQPFGRGMKHFAPRAGAGLKGGQHDS